jgi:hypothetical protein
MIPLLLLSQIFLRTICSSASVSVSAVNTCKKKTDAFFCLHKKKVFELDFVYDSAREIYRTFSIIVT